MVLLIQLTYAEEIYLKREVDMILGRLASQNEVMVVVLILREV